MTDRWIYDDMYDAWISHYADKMVERGRQIASWLFKDWNENGKQIHNEDTCCDGGYCSGSQPNNTSENSEANRARDGTDN